MNTELFSISLELMKAEFESNQLEVALVPSKWPVNEGGCIRVAISKNCTWYRDFCARHLSARVRRKTASDTRIKRRNVARALEILCARKRSSKYDE